MPAAWMGAVVGLFLGYIAVRFGFWPAVGVGVCGLVGYGFAAICEWLSRFFRGDIDVVDQLSRFQQSRRNP